MWLLAVVTAPEDTESLSAHSTAEVASVDISMSGTLFTFFSMISLPDRRRILPLT